MKCACPFSSSIGKKAIVSITGILLMLFVIAHLLGNMTIFFGPDALNAYAKKLQSLGPGLWLMRGGLLTIFVVHVVFALCLARQNRAARPIGYAKENTVQASYASRIMVISGLLLLLYIIVHLSHFTLGWIKPESFGHHDDVGRHDVYRMVIEGFQTWYISLFYLLGMVVLCFHLWQAIGAFPQTLGLTRSTDIKKFKSIGAFVALIIFIGYSAIPIAVYLGIVQ